jgi:succinoglycan biosynthesis protein ExoL
VKNILFFLSHQPNPRFIKQINFLAASHTVSVIYFKRKNLPDLGTNLASGVAYLLAGEVSSNGGYLSRIWVYLQAFWVLWQYRKNIACDVIIVNNVDVLMLEKLVQWLQLRPAMVVLEVSDLLQYVFDQSIFSRLFRTLDKTLVRLFVHRLIVTSGKYHEVYYASFFRGPHLVLENKPLSSNVPPRLERPLQRGPLVVGVVGLIYQAAPLRALFEAVRGNSQVEVRICGRLYDAQNSREIIERACAEQPNIVYQGGYDFFRDAARIYSGLDLLYVSYDTADNMQNNRVALPNKLYEAMYFRVPIVASKGTYLAERVLANGIGYAIDCGDVEQICTVLQTHSEKVPAFEQSFQRLKDEAFFADCDYEVFGCFVTETFSTK